MATIEAELPSTQDFDDDAERFGDQPAPRGKLLRPINDTVGEDGKPVIDWIGHRKVAKEAVKLWESQDSYLERDIAQWRANTARRQGISNVKVRFDNVDERWTVRYPNQLSPDTIPEANKAATLCRRLKALLFTDPPAPIVEPTTDEDDNEDAAETSTRALIDLQSEANLNTVKKLEDGFDVGSEYGSGFVRYWVDPRGGGRQPIEIEAGFDPITKERAQTVQDAEQRTVVQPNPIDPTAEPLTAQVPWQQFEPRYVRQDGTLTDDPDDELIALRWTPAIKSEVITGRAVRPIPHTADDIWSAQGVQFGTWPTWGELKRQYPELTELSKEDRQKFFRYRPDKQKQLFPDIREPIGKADENDDERRVWVLFTYYQESEADGYPEGLELVTVADQYVLYREGWSFMLPVSQISQWKEGREGFYKVGTMELIGGANEARSAQLAALLDHLEKFNRPRILLPYTSTIRPEQLSQLSRGAVIPFNPGGDPKFEPIPTYPPDSMNAFAILGDEMDEAVGSVGVSQLEQDTKSGRHVYALLGQVHAGLSEPRQFIERAYIRCCRIELELAQAFIDTPQSNWVSDNGRYRETRWTGADLTETEHVAVKPGTNTMLSPGAKAQFAEYLLGQGLISLLQAQEIMTTNAGGFIGLQDNPFRLRIRRQLAEWEDGPPEGYQGPPPPIAQPVQQIDPVTGQLVEGIQMVPAPDPVAQSLFDPLPSDEFPEAVPIRTYELAKFMAGVRYRRYPPLWQQLVINEYLRMAQLAAPPALPPAEGGGENPIQPPTPEGVPTDQAQGQALV